MILRHIYVIMKIVSYLDVPRPEVNLKGDNLIAIVPKKQGYCSNKK